MSEKDKIECMKNINFNGLPGEIGVMKNGERWYTDGDYDKIIKWVKQQIQEMPEDVYVIANISGRMISRIATRAAFALQPVVDEIQFSGTNFETMTVWKREV